MIRTGQPRVETAPRQQVIAALLDQHSRQRIGLAIFGRPVDTRLRLDRRLRLGENRFHISSSVMSQAGAMSTSAFSRAPSPRCDKGTRQQQRQPSAHAGADQDLRASR